ncbi:MAG: DUF7455 domain-containing protein [Streptosporangiaceae bacterium]
MDAQSQHPSVRKNRYPHQPAPDDIIGPAKTPVDSADRACCCPAKAAVRVIMPASPGRPRETDLLLCGHHYRASRQALAAANAAVHPVPGMQEDTAAWIGLDLCVPAA